MGVTPVIASIHVGPVQLTNASAYRPLSAFKTQEITHVVKLDTSFAVCLFAVVHGALLVRKKLGFS